MEYQYNKILLLDNNVSNINILYIDKNWLISLIFPWCIKIRHEIRIEISKYIYEICDFIKHTTDHIYAPRLTPAIRHCKNRPMRCPWTQFITYYYYSSCAVSTDFDGKCLPSSPDKPAADNSLTFRSTHDRILPTTECPVGLTSSVIANPLSKCAETIKFEYNNRVEQKSFGLSWRMV